MKKNPLVFLKHIREAIADIEDFVKGVSEKEFYEDAKTQNAVIRSVEIIGEAARNLPEGFRQKHPQVEWKGMVGMRDVIVHEYFEINWRRVWLVIKKDLPVLKNEIEKTLKEERVPSDTS